MTQPKLRTAPDPALDLPPIPPALPDPLDLWARSPRNAAVIDRAVALDATH